ncbi:uncharacterized protein TNCT_668881 [Trichonephila clavata]|uniref:Uncharacterized protein n=1 Tax=Trichonephila clavata TaxID=2740835 RepID=A0A8X6LG59_TRICU|nr:uncharacterized protein TNCT_668881 [Trichonephila clavata]
MLKHNQTKRKETSNSALKKSCKITIPEEEISTIPVLKPLNSVLFQFTREIPNLLYFFLCLFGLQQTSRDTKKNIRFLVLISVTFLIIVDNLGINIQIILKDSSVVEINFAFILCMFLPIASWFMMRCNKKHLMKVLRELEDISSDTHKRKTNYLVIVLCSMPLIFSILIIVTSKSDRYLLNNPYEFELKDQWVQIIVMFLRCFFYFLYYPIFSDLIALLFCTLCLKCCNAIEQLTSDVIQCSPENFKTSTQINFLTRKAKIDNILFRIQNSFSYSSFFIILANILSCGSILGSLLKEKLDEIECGTLIIWAFYATNSFGSLMAILWIAGGVPLALGRLKDEYFKKAHQKMLLAPFPDEPKLEKWLIDRPDFVLTGCNIFSYKRNSLLAVVGTLLTYTFLVINK